VCPAGVATDLTAIDQPVPLAPLVHDRLSPGILRMPVRERVPDAAVVFRAAGVGAAGGTPARGMRLRRGVLPGLRDERTVVLGGGAAAPEHRRDAGHRRSQGRAIDTPHPPRRARRPRPSPDPAVVGAAACGALEAPPLRRSRGRLGSGARTPGRPSRRARGRVAQGGRARVARPRREGRRGVARTAGT